MVTLGKTIFQRAVSTLQKLTLCGKILLLLVLSLGAFGSYVLLADPELGIEANYDSYIYRPRQGFRRIGIEQSRQVWCFGFKGAGAFAPKLSKNEIMQLGGSQEAVAQYRLVISNGTIESIQEQGSFVGSELNNYVGGVIWAWRSGTGPRFTPFIDRLQVKLRVYPSGKLDVEFEEVDWTQPCDPSDFDCLRLYYIARQKGKIGNLFPLEDITIGRVETDEGVQAEFQRLEQQKEIFCNGRCP